MENQVLELRQLAKPKQAIVQGPRVAAKRAGRLKKSKDVSRLVLGRDEARDEGRTIEARRGRCDRYLVEMSKRKWFSGDRG
jgi:hypothetical protein